ncbi:pyridoxamine 5'-phosphate oxidase family protein [Shewanella woodyi]|uniref:Pyridoxamine 5'-phosphate oxidase-related FMN-binding n=1 Tax=Shewanella woodyi (strain ATCC 51908 / MS32) TaxID=392500 RepID=B1KGF5_SHEWM|nr:pyridoxamine 5'-phosphate oxidase family protein [Shewanella woodyi]ACA88292.1 pyridoxamine 5'-phosphate oxidase-related FMN-binding [Shewanella woodyi ATCC 51908]
MGKQFAELSSKHIEFIEKQKIYFVATAAQTGCVNLSPKGGDSLRVISSSKIAWLNLTGSGNESASHVLQDPRMTIMFCAFEGSPLILRTYGQAEVLHVNDAEWEQYAKLFPESVAARQIFVLDITLVQSSCGMSVPYFTFESDRDDLAKWSDKHGTEGIEKYWVKRNQKSIDGFDTEIVQRAGIKQNSSDS